MIKKLTSKEKTILTQQAYESWGFPHSIILYIYFIVVGKSVVYVGKTGCPLVRETLHRTWLNQAVINNYRFVVVGPIEQVLATELEIIEISKRVHNKRFINKNSKYINYGKDKKLSIEDYRQNAISFVRKGSEIKTMVGKFLN